MPQQIAVMAEIAVASFAGRQRRALEPELSIVMPVYNEEESLSDVLDETLAVVGAAPWAAEIVLVDDASTDRSIDILRDYERRHPGVVRVLGHESNRGIMSSLDTLYRSARGRYVFFNASDGQWRTAECLRFLESRDQYDIVVGRRRAKNYTLWRLIVSGSFNLLPRILFGVRTYDAGSIKLFRADVLRIPLLSESPFREAERIIRASRRGHRIGVVDVEHHERRGGRATGARLGLVAWSIADLLRCWWDIVLLRHS
jgi:glycosyltransferase involved in cell wall biosynthesis